MKKTIYLPILLLAVVCGLVFANREIKKKPSIKSTQRPLSAAGRNAVRERWEASPDGITFKKWEASPTGQKVLAGMANIRKPINAYTDMKAVILSTALPPGSRLGFGVMAKIQGEEYILTFSAEKADELRQLKNLKVNDEITVRSHGVSYAPKYAYPIVSGDYVEQDGKMIYKRAPGRGGC